ncbi:MAG: nucleotidyltransferase domain-containing protein [Coriobacteriia bacterium]|nr:nucleotidyltransferase domain-containing protein [Coriobacteriia bacterium]MCL2745643.1 nucleotidyltransferase domain-containing protein [Coriobacteriia bacterium]MCL2870504.1 nucleotidyltransferase domain-containing protein [Coriobacteriia bacterium]
MSYAIEDIKKHALPILLREASDLKRIVVFGSYARGSQTKDSDLDIYIDGRLDYQKGETKDTEQKVSEALAVPVGLLTRNALRNSVIREQLQQSIDNDGVVLYG